MTKTMSYYLNAIGGSLDHHGHYLFTLFSYYYYYYYYSTMSAHDVITVPMNTTFAIIMIHKNNIHLVQASRRWSRPHRRSCLVNQALLWLEEPRT